MYGVKVKLMVTSMTIGKLAESCGVNVETIRYYQRRGLLEEPARVEGGYRRYPVAMTKRLRFIKRAQALGFTLTEVGGLLRLGEGGVCVETRSLAVGKASLIDKKIADLTAMRAALRELAGRCDASAEGTGCPILEALAGE